MALMIGLRPQEVKQIIQAGKTPPFVSMWAFQGGSPHDLFGGGARIILAAYPP
jgi:hypothetical protein